jgi:hypothetical protein
LSRRGIHGALDEMKISIAPAGGVKAAMVQHLQLYRVDDVGSGIPVQPAGARRSSYGGLNP